MIKELIKLANHLDRINLVKEANYIDALLKVATKVSHGEMNEKVRNLSREDLGDIGMYTSEDEIDKFEKILIKIIKKLRPTVTEESISRFITRNSFEIQKELKSNIDRSYFIDLAIKEIINIYYLAILRYEEPPEEIKQKIWKYMLDNNFVNREEQTIKDAEFWEVKEDDTGYDLAIKEGWYTMDPNGKIDKVFYGEI